MLPSRRRYARLSPTWANATVPSSPTSAAVTVVPMPGRLGVGARPLADAAVRDADRRAQRLLAVMLDQVELGERLGAHARRELAGQRAAHAVGDHEERRAQEERVLVGAADVAGLGQAGRIDDADRHSPARYSSCVWPIVTTSPRPKHAPARDSVAVHERPVGRAQVLDHVPVLAVGEPGMAAGSIPIGTERDIERVVTSCDEIAADVDLRALRELGARDDHAAAPAAGAASGAPPAAWPGVSTMLSWPTAMSRDATRITRQTNR